MDIQGSGTNSRCRKSSDDKENSASKRKRFERLGIKVTYDSDDSVLSNLGLGMLDTDASSSCDTPPSPLSNKPTNIVNSPGSDIYKFFGAMSDHDDSATDNSMNSFMMSSEQMQRAAKVTPSLAKFVTNANHQQIIRARNPLSAVVVGNSSRAINTTPTVDVLDTPRKQQPTRKIARNEACDENFFLYKRMNPQRYTGENYFTRLSDEVILSIFKLLPKKTLVRCSLVNQQFKRVAFDESLWSRLDLGKRTIAPGLGKILFNGVLILRLAQSTIHEPIFELSALENPKFQTRLQYLDLSMAVLSKTELRLMLSKCRLLKKLSLEHVPLSDDICREISENKSLEALNLAMCSGISAVGIQRIVNNLKCIQSLNISWTDLNADCVQILVNGISPDVLRLNLAGCRKSLTDDSLKILVKRCKFLLELDLSDCSSLTSKCIKILCQLNGLEYLSLSRCYSISAIAYAELSLISTLKFLDVFGALSSDAIEVLQRTFPKVGINKFHHSSVARPTVGTRRTSIWGLRTRD